MAANSEQFTGGTRVSRLDGLDALRGVAALLVVFMHLDHVAGTNGPFQRGYLAVDLFFVLSGYVMARSYENSFATGLGPFAFVRIRVHRLWPTMCVGALLGLLAFSNGFFPMQGIAAFAMAALFIPSLRPEAATFPQNPPTWSIMLELFANALHVLLLRHMGIRLLAALALICAAVLMLRAQDMNVGALPHDLWLGIPRVLFSYAVGMLIWRLRGDRPVLPCWIGLILLPLAIVLADLTTAWPDFLIVFLLFPVIVLSGLSPPRAGRSVLGFFGSISFPLYAVHFPILMMMAQAGYGSAVSLIVVVAAAWLISLRIEVRWPFGAKQKALST